MSDAKRRCIVVCGPTASGKSDLSDEFSEALSTSAILVDSMQVYREIPVITNQARRRPARLSGIISVSDDWSVADHRSALRTEIGEEETQETQAPSKFSDLSRDPFVLDAGTGMYLNASILDIPLAPKALEGARETASRFAELVKLADGGINERRVARVRELELSVGEDARGSIWDGELLYDATIFYIRPSIEALEEAIRTRSRRIVQHGVCEVERLSAMISGGTRVNKSVLDSIGVKELLPLVSGVASGEARREVGCAEERINIRTRRLAKRQIRWFDKLIANLQRRNNGNGGANILVSDFPDLANNKDTMHDIIESWNL